MLQSVIGQIGIFMICAQAILQFRPKEAYGKYLRLLFSAMILIQIVQPISGFFFGGSGRELEKSMQQFQSSVESSMAEAAKRAVEAEKQLEDRSLLELEERLSETTGTEEGEPQKIEIVPIEKIRITERHGNKGEQGLAEKKGD